MALANIPSQGLYCEYRIAQGLTDHMSGGNGETIPFPEGCLPVAPALRNFLQPRVIFEIAPWQSSV
jgi:hypothetical protein